mgnify:CR=1 FL=1
MPVGSVIRSADLILSYDTTLTNSVYNVIIDPVGNDSMYVDSTNVYDMDPFEAVGYPYRVSTDSEKGLCVLSIKEVLQNITLGNIVNLGFKLIANEKNDPFESIKFEKNSDMRFDIRQKPKAYDILNDSCQDELADIIYNYGEEIRSRSIAIRIIMMRPIHSVRELVEAIRL